MSLTDRQKMRLAVQRELLKQRREQSSGASLILDLGHQTGLSGADAKAIFPDALVKGVDLHPPYCLNPQDPKDPRQSYSELLNMDALEFLQHFNATADIIICAELIEHLEKRGAQDLLKLITTRCLFAIVTTPRGLLEQGGFGGNPHEEHKSGWEPFELEAEGYRTQAILTGVNCVIYTFLH